MKLDNLYVSELEFEDSGMRGPKGESGDAPSLNIEKVSQYLYVADLKNYDYQAGETFVRKYYPVDDDGACASVAKGGLLGHNYDGKYDNTAEFVVRTPARRGANSVVGIAAIPGVLTMDMVNDTNESDLTKQAYDVLPLFMIDGMNDKGVAASVHYMPDADTDNSSDDSAMCALFAVRYLLDNANSATEAAELIAGQEFWFPRNQDIKAGFYLLVSDKNNTYKVDLKGNYEVYQEGEQPVMTNFRNLDDPEAHANGIERYNILMEAYAQINNERDMLNTLKGVRYTGVYDTTKDAPWYSDYNGDWSELGFGDLTVGSTPGDYAGIVAYMVDKFAERERDGQTKQTVHTVVYNTNNLSMFVMAQEQDDVHIFCLNELNLLYEEIERAKAAEDAIRSECANTFYTKSEVDDSLASLSDDLETQILDDVSENYYNKTETDDLLSDLHDQIGNETDRKLEEKADAYENEGVEGQVLYKSSTGAAWGDLPPHLPNVTSNDDDGKVLVVESGEWVPSDRFADYIRYINITVSIMSDNGGVPVNVLTVTVRNNDTGDVISESVYAGQPLTFRVPRGLAYKIEQSGVWEGYHNPTPEYVEGVANNDTSVVFTFEAIRVPETLRQLQIIVEGGSASSMRNHIGMQFEDTYTESGRTYPIIWDLKDVINVEDAEGHVHTGVVLEWHYATPTPMPFDAPERLEVNLQEEPIAQPGVYYYGQTGSTYRMIQVNAGDPLPTTYDVVYKNAIRNTDLTNLEVNFIRRGYSNYAESAIRKWLISDQPAGSWWSATHVGDMPPDAATQIDGFMRGCSNQILSMAKPVKVKYAVTSETAQTVCDKFFIPSVDEVCGMSHNVPEGMQWADWVEATGLTSPDNAPNSGRRILDVTSKSTAAPSVGLRTANVGYQYIVWDIKANGSLDGYAYASALRQFTPCCVVY